MFEDALRVGKEAINESTNGDSRTRNILDFGDYNFPCIEWPLRRIYVNENAEKINKDGEKQQAEMYLNFQDEYFMENCGWNCHIRCKYSWPDQYK